MIRPTRVERDFASALERLAKNEDRAALAALRRGLGKSPGAVADMYPYVVRWVPEEAGSADEEAYYLVASLFGQHQGSWIPADAEKNSTNLGASFRRLVATEEERKSVEKRFIALLNCHRDDLPHRLRHAVSLLKSKEVPIDWALLLHDIRAWERPDRLVQRSWARAFYGYREDSGTDASAATGSAVELDGESERTDQD